MALQGVPQLQVDLPQVKGKRVVILAARWHAKIVDGLVEGAARCLSQAGCSYQVVRVPGTFELPLGAKLAAQHGADGVVALGVVIRGGTPHFDYVCDAATYGLTKFSVESGLPLGFGVLTCDDEAQALDRAGLVGSKEDKGFEAAAAVLEMLSLDFSAS